MPRTGLSFLEDEELITMANCRDNKTELEVELAQRLTTAVDYISDLEARLEEYEPSADCAVEMSARATGRAS